VKATAAKNVLSDEVRRWAYDRFGESVGRWRGVVTEREFLISGLMNSIGFYVVSAGVLAFWSLTGQSSGRTAFVSTISSLSLFTPSSVTPTCYPSNLIFAVAKPLPSYPFHPRALPLHPPNPRSPPNTHLLPSNLFHLHPPLPAPSPRLPFPPAHPTSTNPAPPQLLPLLFDGPQPARAAAVPETAGCAVDDGWEERRGEREGAGGGGGALGGHGLCR
jgi:hypothetical protein